MMLKPAVKRTGFKPWLDVAKELYVVFMTLETVLYLENAL